MIRPHVLKIFKSFRIRLTPSKPKLGRWALKHDISKCDNYIINYHGDPGYPNNYKWVDKFSK